MYQETASVTRDSKSCSEELRSIPLFRNLRSPSTRLPRSEELVNIDSSVMIEALAKSNLKILDISRNAIEDETLIMLGDLYKEGQRIKLLNLNFSSCHITDIGLLYFMEAISDIDTLKILALKDNFISEGCEKLLLDLVDKNEHLTEFELKGRTI